MDLKEFLINTQIVVKDLNSKEEFFSTIANIAKENDIITDEAEMILGLKEREEKSSTGLLDGFAIPHVQTATVKKAAIIIVKSNTAVKWETLDGEPVKTAVCLAVPKSQVGSTHIDFLSEISKLLIDDDFRNEINSLKDRDAIYEAFLAQF